MSDTATTHTLPVDRYLAVGPFSGVYGHGPVTLLGRSTEQAELKVCLDCGYATADMRRLAHIECDRSNNPISQSWREYLDDEEFPTEDAETPVGDPMPESGQDGE